LSALLDLPAASGFESDLADLLSEELDDPESEEASEDPLPPDLGRRLLP
jgi:hypothetical protein